ncbi:tryptophan synthase subunit alpha [Nocardiopsis valliformis]|uniref:tryptophan synthase subunit alpha n=1 Tax=Nocardiopsis valliformis TaxID=239974 RepID=UPI0003488B36|nr:tryptophan synthase subunit alpha [Nocardiopsis valliformis]
MNGFFTGRPPGTPGLVLFLNAGDPPLRDLPRLAEALDTLGVDCLELAVPFPDSATDGPVIRRSARRALADGADLDRVLAAVERIRPRMRRMRIVLLADWRHTVWPVGTGAFVRRVRDQGADGLLVHGLPPRGRDAYLTAVRETGLPSVTTCYAGSDPAVVARAAAEATAFVYLVAYYGRSGGSGRVDPRSVAATAVELRKRTDVPIVVGFGVSGAADTERMHCLGADAVVVGSAAVESVERALTERRDVVPALEDLVRRLRPHSAESPTPARTGAGSSQGKAHRNDHP